MLSGSFPTCLQVGYVAELKNVRMRTLGETTIVLLEVSPRSPAFTCWFRQPVWASGVFRLGSGASLRRITGHWPNSRYVPTFR